MNDARPPIRIATRLLAEMQTSIIAHGLSLAGGDLDRFAILSLVVRQTMGSADGTGTPRGMSVKSLADSLSKPYESVRRHVRWLVDARLCDRRHQGIGIVPTTAADAALGAVVAHAHDALVRFIEDMATLGIALPEPRLGVRYDYPAGVEAAVDIMLAVLDGNRLSHREWEALVIFSTILALNVDGFARDSGRATALADETAITPPDWLRPVSTLAVARVLGMAETSVRRHVDALRADGRVTRERGGLVFGEAWLNQPGCVAVSRASLANVHRILHHLAARGFPFTAPASAYIGGRPADVAAAVGRPRGLAPGVGLR